MNPTILTLCFLAFAVVMFVLEKIPLALTATIRSGSVWPGFSLRQRPSKGMSIPM